MFSIEREALRSNFSFDRVAQWSFLIAGVFFTTAPLLFQQSMGRVPKTISGIGAIGSLSAFCWKEREKQQQTKIFQSLENADLDDLKQSLASKVALNSATNKMAALNQLALEVAALPPWQHARWVQQFGLQGMLPSPAVDVGAVEATSPTLTFSAPDQLPIEDLEADSRPDYSWLDDNFIDASKGVFGAKGSGKSTFLAYDAIRFLQLHPDGELRIGDLHYDEKESLWLPGVPPEQLLKTVIADRTDGILKQFRRARALVEERIERKDRNGKPFKLICDEFVGVMTRLDKDEQEEVLKAIQLIQFEGRKYNVNVVLGLHSVKKGQSGIDSSVLANMDLLCLGKSLADRSTQFPADFDCSALLKGQEIIQSQLRSGDGFACVVRKLGESPQVVVLPYLSIPKAGEQVVSPVVVDLPKNEDTDKFEGDVNPVEVIQSWVQKIGRTPTDDELRAAWKEVTGHQLNAEGLAYLRQNIGNGTEN